MQKNVTEALNWRYATKRFDSTKKISSADWATLEQALILSPSSYGLQPWKFLVIQNPKIREQLKASSWNQTQVTDCSHFVVLATRPKMTEKNVDDYVSQISKVRGTPVASLKEYREMMVGDVVKGPRSEVISFWAQKQAYIAMGFLMETAALLKIDTCPMEGLDPAAYDKILKLEETDFKTAAAVAVGYRHPEDSYQNLKKVRFDRNTVIQIID